MTALESIQSLRAGMARAILGQEAVVDALLIALLADGHVLMEGLPGLAKTRSIKSLAAQLDAEFRRIQFTPDLLPADVTGTEVLAEAGGELRFRPGPIFGNLVLADEINRAPAKVQAALLEAMEERQVSVAGTTHPLPPLFLVMATQNPIEQEGTYPLPEAQMDRFLMHVRIDYPPQDAELEVLRLVRREERAAPRPAGDAPPLLPIDVVLGARTEVHGVGVAIADAIERYVRAVVHECLRHRIVLSYEAEADGVSADDVIRELVRQVAVA